MVRLLLKLCAPLYGLDKFINVTIDDEDPITPLETAIEYGSASIRRILVDAGANMETTSKGKPLLLKYVEARSPGMVSRLLNLGANPNYGPPKGPTPLMKAISNLDSRVVDLLLQDSHTDPNLADEKGLTALMRIFDTHNRKPTREVPKTLDLFKRWICAGKFDMGVKDKHGESLCWIVDEQR